MSARPDVLVVGAGPTGLALALQAHAHGAGVRVVERRATPFRPSRALIVHPRTLEVLRPLGVVDALRARADTAPSARLHLGRRVVPVTLAGLDLPDSAFPHLTLLRQADVEDVLGDALARRGVQVERGTELVGLDRLDSQDGPRAALRSPAGLERTACRWIVGCDGTDSSVRGAAGIGWPGGGYRPEIVLADLELDGDLAPGVAHVVAGRSGLLFVFALGERATWRLLATRPCSDPGLRFGQSGPPVPAAELQRLLEDAGLGVRICRIGWSTRVRVQHRLATTFRRGPLFLAGDAAHTHSPAGGQGMNTGIQDAANLGWKLGFAAGNAEPDQLLDTYDAERRPVARHVLALTHAVFWAEAATDPLASFVRGTLAVKAAPAVPMIMRRHRLVAEAVRLLAQFRESYRDSPLSVEVTPQPPRRPRAGDRMPDMTMTTAAGHRVRLHQLTGRPGVHVLLPGATVTRHVLRGPLVHLHRLATTPGSDLFAIRPDGYVGLRGGCADGLYSWLSRVGAARYPDPHLPADESI